MIRFFFSWRRTGGMDVTSTTVHKFETGSHSTLEKQIRKIKLVLELPPSNQK